MAAEPLINLVQDKGYGQVERLSIQTFTADQLELNQKLEAQSVMLRKTEQRLEQDQARYNEETDQLHKLVEGEQQKVRKTNEQLRREEIEFGNVKRDMENRIADERKKVSDLTSKLERQTERQEKEKVTLEGLIAEEKTRLAELQEQLQAETLQFENRQEAIGATNRGCGESTELEGEANGQTIRVYSGRNDETMAGCQEGGYGGTTRVYRKVRTTTCRCDGQY